MLRRLFLDRSEDFITELSKIVDIDQECAFIIPTPSFCQYAYSCSDEAILYIMSDGDYLIKNDTCYDLSGDNIKCCNLF